MKVIPDTNIDDPNNDQVVFGGIYRKDGDYYILAAVGPYSYALINITTGHMWSGACKNKVDVFGDAGINAFKYIGLAYNHVVVR